MEACEKCKFSEKTLDSLNMFCAKYKKIIFFNPNNNGNFTQIDECYRFVGFESKKQDQIKATDFFDLSKLTTEQQAQMRKALQDTYYSLIDKFAILDCYFPKVDTLDYYIGSSGEVRELKQSVPPDEKDFNNYREKEDAKHFARYRQIFDALANFSAENDKYNLVKIFKIEDIYSKEDREVITKHENAIMNAIFFSSKELAQSALEMLKRNRLV